MHASYSQFKIEQLRQDKNTHVLESIAVILIAVFINLFLPSLLFQYVYADQQLTAEPALLQYIPLVTFSGAVLFVIYAFGTNILRARKIKRMEKELVLEMSMGDGCCGGDCNCGHDHDHHEMMEVEVVTPKKKSSKK